MQVFPPTVLALIRSTVQQIARGREFPSTLKRLHPTLTAILLDKATESTTLRWMILQALDLMLRADPSLLLLPSFA